MGDAENTRQNILEISADEIHKHGFTATSLSVILNRCCISKGALYHHFSSKLELGYAVFEEIFAPMILESWEPAVSTEDPIEGLCQHFIDICNEMECDEMVCGCPLNNLCEEMANVDEGFRLRILSMQTKLNSLIASALEDYQAHLQSGISYKQVAYFIVATFHGATSLSKSSRNKELFEQVVNQLCIYLRSLKA
ncbi:TetR/AcrR family transcriptional regulator [Thalassotalea atypica]|uniref:TetR/AcrR family transcriptional regulator n=1 Tax=Thalassotalea atypica TaxID=2054316 RepID=UPI0025732A80|nr:TetR/AcrR family transcriptional regulator [Thalassotalea atypica]